MWIVTSVLGSEAEPLRDETDECFRRGGLEAVEGILRLYAAVCGVWTVSSLTFLRLRQ